MKMNELYKYTKELNILFVEDNKNIAYELSKIFEMLFSCVTVCANGEEGLESYKSKQNFFDIVLTDIKMPRMDGLEMIKFIRDLNPTQHIMIISAHDDKIDLTELMNFGIDNFLIKPIDKFQLKKSLLKICKNISNEKEVLNNREKLIASNKYLEEIVQLRTKELKDQLFIDNLTGLQNRASLLDSLNSDMFTLMALVDIDRLQFINSLYGVKIGNVIIDKFAKLLQKELSHTDYKLFKTAGDEFAICSGDKKSEEFENIIRQISKKVTNLVIYVDEVEDEIMVDATIGYTIEINYLSELDMIYDTHLLLTQCDAALKYAKTYNKPLVSFDESMNTLQDMQNITTWKKKIKEAYESDNIVPVFQPIVNSNGDVLKYETLMRLRDVKEKEFKLISPFFFLDIAVMTNQYSKLSERIIAMALNHLKYSKHTLSINLTYTDIQNKNMIILLEDTLKNNNIGDRLIIEIVESEDVSDYNLLDNFIQKFREFGVKIAIDDFGSGFSNFKNIIDFKPDYLKIDGSLVKNIDNDANSVAIVKCIVQFAHNIGIKVIAEFVHSKEVLEVLKDLDIDEYQGFYFYEPALDFVNEEVLV